MKQPSPPRWLMRLVPYVLPCMLLLALWLPGVTQGGLRVDSDLYAALAHSAWHSGELWHLSGGEQPYFNKPPLAFWLGGVPIAIFGPKIWAVRLGSLIGAMACCIVLAHIVRRHSGPRCAVATVLVLALTLEFFRYTRAFSIDIWMTLVLLLGIGAALSAVRNERPARLLLMGLFIGLALLAKPLLALGMIPVVWIWLAWCGRLRWSPWMAGALCVSLLVAAPWHLTMWQAFGDQFIDEYFGRQTLARVTGEMSESPDAHTPQPWWYFIGLIVRMYWPWLIPLTLALVALLRGRRLSRDAYVERLILLWVVCWIALLSLSPGKSGRYLIMLYPMLAWIVGLWLVRLAPVGMRRGGRVSALWFGPLALVISIVVSLTPLRVHEPRNPAWDEFEAWWHSAGKPVLWMASPDMRFAADIYVITGAWPRIVVSEQWRAGDVVKPGALVVYQQRDAEQSPEGRLVLETTKLLIIEVRSVTGL